MPINEIILIRMKCFVGQRNDLHWVETEAILSALQDGGANELYIRRVQIAYGSERLAKDICR